VVLVLPHQGGACARLADDGRVGYGFLGPLLTIGGLGSAFGLLPPFLDIFVTPFRRCLVRLAELGTLCTESNLRFRTHAERSLRDEHSGLPEV
jgi:hypothetical protein